MWSALLPSRRRRTVAATAAIAMTMMVLISVCRGDGGGGGSSAYAKEQEDVRWRVLRLMPETLAQQSFVRALYRNATELELHFWKAPRSSTFLPGGSPFWDVMIADSSDHSVEAMLRGAGVPHQTIIGDVERLIVDRESMPAERRQRQWRDGKSRFARRLRDDAGTPPYDFSRYGSYFEMTAWMRSLVRRHPHLVRYISIGRSHNNISIDGLEIGAPRDDQTKRIIWVDGGIHAREWAAPHTALYFIHQLTSRYDSDPSIKDLVDRLTWVIVPVINPDGYEFTRLSTRPEFRLWRKNRSPDSCARSSSHHGGGGGSGTRRRRCCYGVDLNRNFDFHFKETGASNSPCSEIYAGPRAFSEPETRAIRDALFSERYRGRVDAFVTMHTYSQIFIHPYGHKKDTYPGDVADLAVDELEKPYGTRYKVGSGADTLYPASGGSEDWVKHAVRAKFVYLLELRPDEKKWDGFILDQRELLPTAVETWRAIRVVAQEAIAFRQGGQIAESPSASVQARRQPTRENSRQTGDEDKSSPSSSSSSSSYSSSSSSSSSDHHRSLSPSRGGGESPPLKFGSGRDGSCYDLRHACKQWVEQSGGELCRTVPRFMHSQCAYSCAAC